MGLGLIRAGWLGGLACLGRVHLALGCVDAAGGVAALSPSQLDRRWLGAWLDGGGCGRGGPDRSESWLWIGSGSA